MLILRSFVLAASVFLASCGEWDREGAFPSPDGKLIAVVEYQGSGACCSDYSRVRLENASGDALVEPVLVAEITRAKARPHWLSNDKLVIEACAASRIEAQTRILREPTILADGTINEVRIDVVTTSETPLDRAPYCVESEKGS